MKQPSLILFLILISCLKTAVSQTAINPGYHSGVWNKEGSPYLINGDVIIHSDSGLIIEPGVSVEIRGYYSIKVSGILKAVGDVNDTIFFFRNDTTGFSDTSSTAGGWPGLRYTDRQTNDTSELRYCSLTNGKAIGMDEPDNQGGAIYINNYNYLIISNSHIHHNIAKKEGGGIFYDDHSSVAIKQNDISYNRTYYYGGGIYSGAFCDGIISENKIHHNISYRVQHMPGFVIRAGSGGGFYASDNTTLSNLKVTNNFICNNFSMSGGGLYESTREISVIGNIICNNHGTGIFNGHQMGEGLYVNNTVCNNENPGGIMIYSHDVLVVNCIVRGNFHPDVPNSPQIGKGLGANPTVEYCNVEGGHAGDGNIDNNPLFVMPSDSAGVNFNGLDANWSILPASTSVNAGNPDTSGFHMPAFDIAGNPRVQYSRIDIGAYESTDVVPHVPILPFNDDIYTIYPNPSTGQFSLLLHEKETFKMKIINAAGQPIHSDIFRNTQSHTFDFNISGHPQGTYFLILSNDNKVITKTIIKQ